MLEVSAFFAFTWSWILSLFCALSPKYFWIFFFFQVEYYIQSKTQCISFLFMQEENESKRAIWFMFYNLILVMFEACNECSSNISLISLVLLAIIYSWGSFTNSFNNFVMGKYISTIFSLPKKKESWPYNLKLN